MSDPEDNPPDKISSLGLSDLVVAAHFTAAETPLLSMDTIDALAESIGGSAVDDIEEDATNPIDENEGYSSRLEMLADQLIKECGKRGKPSETGYVSVSLDTRIFLQHSS